MGHSPSFESLAPLLETMSVHILKAAGSIDIAFVIDTTSSMQPYIVQVQNKLVQFLKQLQEKKRESGHTCRAALVEYRDKDLCF